MTGPLKFSPWLRTMVWGGNRISQYKQLDHLQDHIGESWEISAITDHASIISDGAYQGISLPDMVSKFREQLVGHHVYDTYGERFPLLIKFIDAHQDLSIQVHPDDDLACRLHGEGQYGKTEMWYVIDAEPGSYLYSGMKVSVTPEEYRSRIADGTICDILARHEVHPGDVFFIPAGRVHAICSGILLAEIQQTSDWTYRIYDYNRLGLDGQPRQLHTEYAVLATDLNVTNYRTSYESIPNVLNKIITCRYFTTYRLELTHQLNIDLCPADSFVALMNLSGTCNIATANGTIQLSTGESALIPACEASFEVHPLTTKSQLLIATA